MDIDLLSNMVKDLILDNEKVVLPGLGCFVAEVVPATFSDRGYTINPPYRRLFFRSHPDEGHLLADLYAKSNNVEVEMADRILRDFLKELRSVLFTRKTVIFPGLGRLRATKENNIFFVADEDLDIYPIGFALETISMKSHQEREERMVSALGQLKDMMAGIVPEEEPAPEKTPAVTTAYEQPVAEPEAEFEEETVEENTRANAVVPPAENPATEANPAPEETPAAEEETPTEETPEEEPAAEEIPAQEPAVEESPAAEEVDLEDTPVAEETAAEDTPAVEENPETQETPAEAPAEVEPAAEEPAPVVEETPAATEEPVKEEIKLEKENTKPHQGRKKALIAVAIILGIAALLIGAFFLINWLAPDFMESLLYTEEELELLHYGK